MDRWVVDAAAVEEQKREIKSWEEKKKQKQKTKTGVLSLMSVAINI